MGVTGAVAATKQGATGEVQNMNPNSEALTLCLSRQLARVDGRNQQQAMIQTARIIRRETKSHEVFESLGLFINATPTERMAIAQFSERQFLGAA